MKQRKINRWLSLTIIICLLITSDPLQAFAGESGENSSNQKVTKPMSEEELNSNLNPTDTTAPRLSKAVINGNILTLNFDKILDAEKVPSSNNFTIKVVSDSNSTEPSPAGSLNTESESAVTTDAVNTASENAVTSGAVNTASESAVAAGAVNTASESAVTTGAVNTASESAVTTEAINTTSESAVVTEAGIPTDTINIVEVNVYDNKVALTLADAVASSSAVTIDYNPSGNNTSLQDKSGNAVESLTDFFVENVTGGSGIPDFVVEEVYNELDTSAFSKKLAREVYYAMLEYKGSREELTAASSDIVSILAQSSATYSGLTDENRSKLCSFFGISAAFFAYSQGKGESLEQAILIHSKMASLGITEEEIEQAVQNNTRDQIISEKEQTLSDSTTEKRMLSATATAEDPFADVKYKQEKTMSAPFQHNSAANEQIDLGSGNLEYNVTDAVLPGAGGLDLVIERQYQSDQANYYDIGATLQYRESADGRAIYSYMDSDERVKYFAKNADGTMGDYLDRTDYEEMWEGDLISPEFLKSYNSLGKMADLGNRYSASQYRKKFTTPTTYMTAKQRTFPNAYNEQLWQLGTGWSFNFSYMEVGSSVAYNYKILHLSDGRTFNVSPNWVNNLGHYTYKDVIFATETSTVAGQTALYNVTYADGKKEYFTSDGRLIAIVDRFGNTISFTYTTADNKTNIQITDTLGRVITITNQAAGNGYNKVLTLPDGKTVTYVIGQNTARTLNALDQYESYPGQYDEYNLTKVINQKGEETIYSYTDYLSGADFSARFRVTDSKPYMDLSPDCALGDDDRYYPNYYAGLTKITYPTGLTVNYDYYYRYNNWYDYGLMRDIAIKKRFDQQGSSICNEKTYTYSCQFKKDSELKDFLYNADNYNNELSDPLEGMVNFWVKEKDVSRNITNQYIFHYRTGYCLQVNTYLGSNQIQQTSTDYRIFNYFYHPSKTKVTTVQYDTSNGQALSTAECYDYDNRGNVISYWPALAEGSTSDTEHKISMTYDNLYNYLTGKTYKRDSATTINEQNVPSANEKTIAQSLVYENGSLKAKSEFDYDTYGNVTKSKRYTDLSAGTYIETDNTYNNGTYLTGIAVQNVKDADGTSRGAISRQAGYDIYGRITSETDANGNVTGYTYDELGRITQVRYPGYITKTYAYNTASNQATVTDERGFVTRYQYDPAGNLTAVYSINNGTATLLKANEYDNLYRLTKEQNNLSEGGGATTYSYDHKDRITRKSSADASNKTLSQEGYTYFADKTTKTVSGDSNSEAIVTTEYKDKYGRVTKQGRFIDGAEIFNTFVYDYLGEVLKEKSARANAESYTEDYTAKYEYDFAGNVKKQYDVLGNYVTTNYDAAGRKISVTDAKSNASGGTYSTTYTYDTLGRLIKEETPFTSNSTAVTKYYYDANGNLIRKQIENSMPGAAAAFTKVEYGYNNKNQLVHVESYDGRTVANQVDYEYDFTGNMIAMITAGGSQRTGYQYDRYGHLITLTDPLGLKETYTYDINGNMTSKTDKNGLKVNYTYDGLARKLSQSIATGGAVQMETFGYTATGALATAQNDNIQISYTYDELGRVVKETESNGVEKEYTYDVNGNLKTSIVKVGGVAKKTMIYTYDKKDRLFQVYEGGNLVATYTYDANGNRSGLTYGNGNSVDYAYNLANLVTSLQNKKGSSTLSSYAYTYYLDGNQAAKTDHTGKLTSYSYDGLGRLTREAESGASDAITKAYTFDPSGNRAAMTVSGADAYTVGYAYDLNNRLTTETKEASGSTDITDYYYDNNGNTIAKRTGILKSGSAATAPSISIDMTGAELYEYDGYDRMTGVQNASGSSVYTYRPDGLRLSKTVNGVTTTHVWEGQNISLELDGSGAVTNRYIRGNGLIKSDNNGWYLFNGHGDVVQLADNAGAVTKSYSYDAFGNEKGIAANDTNPFRYSGEYFDKETGTVYLRARYYEPSIGRFASEDVAHDGSNWYAYCYNDPITYKDANGMKPYSIRYGDRFSLTVTPQWLDVAEFSGGFVPGFTPLNWLAQRSIVGRRSIGYDLSTAAGSINDLAKTILKNDIAQTVTKGVGWALSGIDGISFINDWFIKHEYQMEEAVYNQFNRDIWISANRNIVDKKFEYAINKMTVLMLNGKVEVKKAVDVFGEDAFKDYGESIGMATYQYDPLIGENRIYEKDDYYFFMLSKSASGKISEFEEVITNPRKGW